MTSNPNCSVELAVNIVGNRCKLLILRDLIACSRLTFEEIKERLSPIPNKTIMQSLKELEECGVITKKSYDKDNPQIQIEYRLTIIGLSFIPVMDQFAVWGIEYKKYADSINIDYKNIKLRHKD